MLQGYQKPQAMPQQRLGLATRQQRQAKLVPYLARLAECQPVHREQVRWSNQPTRLVPRDRMQPIVLKVSSRFSSSEFRLRSLGR